MARRHSLQKFSPDIRGKLRRPQCRVCTSCEVSCYESYAFLHMKTVMLILTLGFDADGGKFQTKQKFLVSMYVRSDSNRCIVIAFNFIHPGELASLRFSSIPAHSLLRSCRLLPLTSGWKTLKSTILYKALPRYVPTLLLDRGFQGWGRYDMFQGRVYLEDSLDYHRA